MTPAPLPAPVQADAPHLAIDLARRFGLIMAGLAALVAHRFLRDRRFASLIVPLWTRLNRASGRFARLMIRVAANRATRPRASRPRTPRPHHPAPDQARAAAQHAAGALPAGHAWLIRAIPNEAAAYACQLEYLLSEPGVAELLAACPAAGRILRPLARMLGIRSPALQHNAPNPRAPRRRAPAAARNTAPPNATPPNVAAPRAPLPPGHPFATRRPSAHWPAACRPRANPA